MAALWEHQAQAPERVEPPPSLKPDDAAAREQQIADIAAIIKARHWPADVVYIPSRWGLLSPGSDAAYKAETRRFAQAIGATFHDSSELYAGMTAAQIRAYFLPYDGHWNLAGSDMLGRYVLRLLSNGG